MHSLTSKIKTGAYDTAGFTLIEILIATLVFAVGILAIGSMQISSMDGNAKAIDITEGATITADRIEKIINLPFDDDLLAPGIHSVANGDFTVEGDGLDNDGDGQIDESGETDTMGISVQWIVQDDTPISDTTKTIRIIIQTQQGKKQPTTVFFDYIKVDAI
jgi:prepilin-type N-terminal cleavage/methylation domain-containing protein